MDTLLPSDTARRQPGKDMFTLALDLSSGTSIPTHHHREGQLLYASAGVLAVTTDHGCWVVPSNHGLWIPPNIPHWTRTIGASSIRTLYISPGQATLLHNGCVLVEVSPLLRELVIAALEIKGDISLTGRNAKLIDLLMEELVAAPVSSMYLPSPNGERLKGLCREIFLNGTLNWGLAECASFLNVNAKTVQRWFTTDLGMSFGAWRKQARLLVALEWLALGRNILEVSLEAGYSSPSAFSSMFRKEFGAPPSVFQMP